MKFVRLLLAWSWTINWCNSSVAPVKPVTTTQPVIAYGDRQAPHQVVEFYSMYCPACDQFDQMEFPKLVNRYVRTGQVYWVRVPFPQDMGDLRFLVYLKHLPIEQRGAAETWYRSFRERSAATDEAQFNMQLDQGIRDAFPELGKITPPVPADIDLVVQETLRLVETYHITEYPTFWVAGAPQGVSELKATLQKIIGD